MSNDTEPSDEQRLAALIREHIACSCPALLDVDQAAHIAAIAVEELPDLQPPRIGKVPLTDEAKEERRRRVEQAAVNARNITRNRMDVWVSDTSLDR